MPTVRLISREEAQKTRAAKVPGVRRLRKDEFDTYVQPLLDNPGEAAVYEEIEETPQKFVLSLRGAFNRAGMSVVVRKMRGRNEVRAWIVEPKPAPVPVEEAPQAKRGGRRKAS